MEGKDAIINKIMSDADSQAEEILAQAKAKAEAQVKKALDESEALQADAAKKAEDAGSELITRRLTVAGLDVKKQMLAVKKELIDASFAKAESVLAGLEDDDYLKLISAMLAKSASDGDTVTVSAKDKSRITVDFIKKQSKKLGISLTLGKEYGDFDGGIILTGGGVDKNLTLEVELKLLYDEIQADVAAILFKETENA